MSGAFFYKVVRLFMPLELAPSWQALLSQQFEQPYMQELKSFLRQQKDQQRVIYPHSKHWFYALEATALEQVKVVILGQDPYHQPHQAHGLCFSVLPNVKIPPSLANIYKELEADLGISPAAHGYLESWATQGVLLLNSVLTVEQNKAGSHQGKGWELFTDEVIKLVNSHTKNVVFMLWGSYAQKKGNCIDTSKHKVLKSSHPSPLSVYRGFSGCRHFSKANNYLKHMGREEINWQLPATIEI